MMEGLSSEQRDAVEARGPRILVSAGAGSGKTRVLTERFLRLVAEGLDLDEVAAVTFTEKAAGELKRRIRKGLSEAGRRDAARRVPDAWISTIHGLCRRLLREHGLDAGIDPGSRVLAEHEALALAEEAFEAAASSLLEEQDPDLLAVLDAEDVAAVAERVRAAYGKTVAAGLDPNAIESQRPLDPAGFRRIAEGLRDAIEDMRGFRATKTQQDNIESALRLAELFEQAADAGVLEGQAAWDMLQRTDALRFRSSGSEEFKAVVAEAKELRDAARALLMQAAVLPHERGLAKLTARFAHEYARVKREAGALDFDDLQMHVATLLRRPETARSLAGRFTEVMVDEYQDTNPLQASITEALAGDSLVAVGDKRQSIYRFRYADVRVFERFAGQAVVKALTENWRSHPDVLAVVNEAFGHPALFGAEHQVLRAAPGNDDTAWPESEPRVKVLLAIAEGAKAEERRRAEAEMVAEEIQRLCDESGISPGDIAILSRALKRRASVFENALRARGIEVACGAGNLFDTPEAHDGLMLIRAIDNVLDDEALMHVLSGAIGGLGPDALFRLRSAGGTKSLWHGLERAEDVLDPPDCGRAVAVREAILAARRYLGMRFPGRALLVALRRSGHEAALKAQGASGAQAWQNLRLLARLVDASDEATGRGLHGFIREAEVLKAAEGIRVPVREETDAVRIMSIHAAKGLEFPVVFVVGLTEQETVHDERVSVDCDGPRPRIALRRPLGQDGRNLPDSAAYARIAEEAAREDREETKRLLYVAMTRARQGLVLCGSLSGSDRPHPACRALFEALGIELDPASGQDVATAAGVRVPVVRRAFDEAPSVADVVEEPMADRARSPEPEAAIVEEQPAAGSRETESVTRRVSPSALEDFERCPYRFYARHVLGLQDPFEDAGATAFGTAVHAALQHAVAGSWSDERRDALARRHGLDSSTASLLDQAVGAFKSSGLLERIRAHDSVRTEAPFAVAVGDALLVGRMDVLAESSGRSLVIDFKSHGARIPSETEAKPGDAARFERQMRCYALAALAGGAEAVETAIYDVNAGDISAAWTFAAGQRAELEAELHEVLGKIARSDFAPLGRYDHASCVGCPALGGLCSIRGPRRGGAAGRTPR